MTKLVALLGPTATGKSELAMSLAHEMGGEILSVDSMQVYRHMDIGTAKPTPQDQAAVVHHMIDLVEPEEEFSVAQFREVARSALSKTSSPVVFIVGGSGLHFRSVVDPMAFRPHDPEVRTALEAQTPETLLAELLASDPEAGDHLDLSNPRRVLRAVESLRLDGPSPSEFAGSPGQIAYATYQSELDFIGLYLDRDDLDRRVRDRLHSMRSAGFVEEVARLADRLGRTARQAVGYRQLLPGVRGEADLDDCLQEAERATMALVKRQRTFFGRDPRLVPMDAARSDLLEVVGDMVT